MNMPEVYQSKHPKQHQRSSLHADQATQEPQADRQQTTYVKKPAASPRKNFQKTDFPLQLTKLG
jgi:hypothetical protein